MEHEDCTYHDATFNPFAEERRRQIGEKCEPIHKDPFGEMCVHGQRPAKHDPERGFRVAEDCRECEERKCL